MILKLRNGLYAVNIILETAGAQHRAFKSVNDAKLMRTIGIGLVQLVGGGQPVVMGRMLGQLEKYLGLADPLPAAN